MRQMRRIILVLGFVLLVAGGWGIWRAAHPPLTPEQQISANMEAAEQAIENRSVGGVMRHLAPEFSWDGTSRSDIARMLAGTFYQWRDVQLQLANQRVQVNGDTATSSGKFDISYRPAPDAPPESHSGTFTMRWRLRDGKWQVVSGQGGESLRGTL